MTTLNADFPDVSRVHLDSARKKAYWRLLPLLVVAYIIAYVDRSNVGFAKLTMSKDLGFSDEVIGFAAGIFFWGYFLLEIPGTILVEKWSARKWISRIMITWGMTAAATALVVKPWHFYGMRFLLGLCEAGFFPGIIVYITHWFPSRDRSRAFGLFMIATPIAQMASPKISGFLLKIGMDETVNGITTHYPKVLGMSGWQWIYVAWGLPAIVLGVLILFLMPDYPRLASWLTREEADALEQQLVNEKRRTTNTHRHMSIAEALSHPQVILLTIACFCTVTGNYALDFFLPTILKNWYNLSISSLTSVTVLPPIIALAGLLFVGWNSDRTGERRWHAAIPGLIGGVALALTPFTRGHLWLTIACFMIVAGGLKAYLPAFWALPGLFLTEVAAAASVGFINSVGNLGGFFGPYMLGKFQTATGSFVLGIYVLGAGMFAYGLIILSLRLHKPPSESQGFDVIPAVPVGASLPEQ